MTGASTQRLRGRRPSYLVIAALAATVAIASTRAPVAAAVPGTAARPADVVDLSGSRQGVRLAQAARDRFAALGVETDVRDLRVLSDGAGLLIVPRTTRLSAMRSPRGIRSGMTELAPVARPEDGAGQRRVRMAGTLEATPPMSWTVAYTGCYERVTDGWSFIDHCAQILRLQNDGDPSRDSYVLERWATAGANWPWVVKSAAISAYPTETSAQLSWSDWAPRSDRTGPCQDYALRLMSPHPTAGRLVERCETWDVTKAARAGDFRLDWRGCACTHDRELAFSLSVSVAQGRSPSWYVPAEVHGYPF
jgi:hypothetical protein